MDIYTINSQNELCFSPIFFQHCMSEALGDPHLKVISAQPISSPYETNIAKTKYAHQPQKLIGVYKYRVVFQLHNEEKQVLMLVKSKISNKEFINIATSVLLKAGLELDQTSFAEYLQKTPLGNGDFKEIKLYQLALQNPALAEFFPRIYGTYINSKEEQFIILEELLTDSYLIEDYRDISFWNYEKIINAIKDLSRFHAVYYSKIETLPEVDGLGEIMNAETMMELTPLWQAYAANLQSYVGNLLTEEDLQFYLQLINTLPVWWKKIDALSKTLIYNDLQIRNLAMRPLGQQWKLCLFDWEVATTHIPQRDVVEFLSYVISESVTHSDLAFYLDQSRAALEAASHQTIDRQAWLEGCLLALYDYQLERLSVQLIFHKVVNRSDIERVWLSSRRLLKCIQALLSQ